MSLGLIFSGQGGQHPDMLPWLQPDDIQHAMAATIGTDWRARLADAEWAGRNAVAQPLLTGTALSAWSQLAADLPRPSAMAGYSLGEVAALAAAGVVDAQTALWIAQRRAAWMDRDGRDHPAVMLGVTGLMPDAIDALCGLHDLLLAIRNGADSVVLAASPPRVDAVTADVAARGGRAVRLNVNIASHTRHMAEAARDFDQDLSSVTFRAPSCVVFTCADGRVREPAALRQALARQLHHTVRWDLCMEGLASRQLRCVLEIGPGAALARQWNARYPDVPARAIDEFRTAKGIVDWVTRQMD